jgi:hypothetical protein
MFVLSRFAAFESVAWPLAARFVRGRGAAAGIMAIALAAAAASPAWAAGPQHEAAHPQKEAAAAADLNADGSVPDKIVKAGAETLVATAHDCDLPNQAPLVWTRVEHGTTSVKQRTGPSCGRPSMSLAEIFYTSERGFKGTDKLHILGFVANGDIDLTLTILVK